MHAFLFSSVIIGPTWHIEIWTLLPRQKNADGYVMKFTPKIFKYVIFSHLPYRLHPSQWVKKINIYSQCFQMTLAMNLSDLPYTGGSYIDDFRFSLMSQTKKDRRKSIPYNFQPGQIVNKIYRYLENLYSPLSLFSSTRPPPPHLTKSSKFDWC